MSSSLPSTRLRRLAVLYLGMAHRSDGFLSDSELESVIRKLIEWSGAGDRGAVQLLVMNVLEQFSGGADSTDAVRRAGRDLAKDLTELEKRHILDDLSNIAAADGVVLKDERALLDDVSDMWNVAPVGDERRQDIGSWSVLHDLAYVYVVLAHGTDNDLSGTEMQVIGNKLREWIPDAPAGDVDRTIQLAMQEYARGRDQERLEAAVAAVRATLPLQNRMAALNDLIKIANADGVFLDDEEDLINHLQTAWDVDPSANYEPHRDKSVGDG